MGADLVYGADQAAPDTAVTWLDAAGDVIPFAAGWTLSVALVDPGGTIRHTKTSGVTGADTAPNVTIAWSAGEFTNIPPGLYRLRIVATDSGGRARIFRPDDPPTIHIRPAPSTV